MKAGLAAALFATLALGGCAADGPANPNLAAPKLVMEARESGDVVLFVHAAFGERLYEWIHVAIDNDTLANRTAAFSLEEEILLSSFYFDATAGTSRETYQLRGRVEVDLPKDRLHVTFVGEDGEWSDRQDFGLPFERVMPRRSTE